MTLADAPARRRALTELDSSLLVEAAAGTGKTAILAGRAAMLLASGRSPREVAAITFTELAAGELSLRIRQLVETLLTGEVPRVLAPALPEGLSAAQSSALAAAAERLDELTAATIHGFCQRIIQAYAVEADLDPGAAVMDAAQADAMFQGVFVRWLRRRLSVADGGTDAVAVLAADDPLGVVATMRELADLRRRHPKARASAPDLVARPDIDFVQAVDDFARWFSGTPGEAKTGAIIDQLQALASFFSGALAREPDFAELWRLARPPRQPLMKGDRLEWRAYAAKTAWQKVAKGETAGALNATAEAHYATCRRLFEVLLGRIAGSLVAQLSASLDEVLADYAREKRAAAVLDFEDLLDRALQLVRDHEPVRRVLGERYRHILVDEFQDTDPVQAEIIFSIAAKARPERWAEASLRPGSLFLVGDPKQAIYRFRGADVAAYRAVHESFTQRGPENIIQITANFRSAPGILKHVNSCFEEVLSRPGQPGYVGLSPTLEAPRDGAPCVVKMTVALPPQSGAGAQRDEEAAAVADLCRRLVGSVEVRRDDGSRSPLRPGDIALLAPTSTDLWRYERALERVRLSVASQAGRALMMRQETQDFVALVRTLADPFDTLAFGALLRGPLVGLSEAQLLEIAAGLPPTADGRPAEFTLSTPPELVADPVAREVLEVLHALRRRAAGLTPMALLAEAIERLKLRVVLALRTGDRSARALANLDALLQWARPFSVRGLTAFASELRSAWELGSRVTEGRSDESEDAVALVTVHSSKGLEWPVVIPINTSTRIRGRDQFVHRLTDDTLHWVIGGMAPPELEAAEAEEARSEALQRERLWYVACTRARDLLIVPHLPNADSATWARVIDLGHERLQELDVGALRPAATRRALAAPNLQTPELFAMEADRVAAAAPPVVWRRPSAHDSDRAALLAIAQAQTEEAEVPERVGAGRVRGVLLHKLMEELISGELSNAPPQVEARARALRAQLAALEQLAEEALPDATECVRTALATLGLPEIAALRPSLRAEVPLYGADLDGALVAGRADAVAIEDGRIAVVLDWKSDVAPMAKERAAHVGQLRDYLAVTGAPRGAIVYMTRGEVVWVSP